MQLSTMRTNVRSRCGLSASDGLASDAVLTEFINSSIRTFSMEQDWPWLKATESFNTVVGTTSYTPTTGFRTSQSVTSEGTDLPYRTMRDMADPLRFDGSPLFFSVDFNKVVIAPKPDAVYAIVHAYTATETALAADGDEPLIYEWAIDKPIIMAAKLLATRLKDPSLMQLLNAELREVDKAIANEVRQARPAPIPKHRTDWSIH